MKPCRKCGVIERNKRGDCKPCKKMWCMANPEKVKATTKAWRIANPEKRKAITRAWYIANPEKVKARSRAWHIANPAKAKASSRAWYMANPEKAKAAVKAWRIAYPEKGRIYEQNRRARKLFNGGTLSKDLSERLFKQQKGKCACCYEPLGNNFHLDHIMPLSLGGKNEDWNIQLLRTGCNLKKNAKHPITYMQEKGFLL